MNEIDLNTPVPHFCADYERCRAAEKAKDIRSNAIDWEQRRWEVANKLYFWSEFLGNWKDAVEQADKFIEVYKNIQKMEE